MGQISDKDVKWFLCLVVIILNSEKEITLHFLEKCKQRTTNNKINSNGLGHKLFFFKMLCLRHKTFSTLMFTKDRRIQSRSVCLAEPNQNYP